MRLRLTLRKRRTKKSLVCWGTDICNRPEGDTEKRTLRESGFLRTITSPNSGSLIIIFRLELSQDLLKLSVISVFAGEDNRSFGIGRSFEGFDARFVDLFSFFDGL